MRIEKVCDNQYFKDNPDLLRALGIPEDAVILIPEHDDEYLQFCPPDYENVIIHSGNDWKNQRIEWA